MCSIIGYCGKNMDMTAFHTAFARTISRGLDDSRILEVGQGPLGFHRLSIMGLHPEGMQPFTLNGSAVVCNGEIYGFDKFRRKLSSEYSFQSDSDCEILLPLYIPTQSLLQRNPCSIGRYLKDIIRAKAK